MRGPHDKQIVAAETPKTKKAGAVAQPIPGGKPLLRMLQLLDARGYATVAEAAIESVPEAARTLLYRRGTSAKIARRKTTERKSTAASEVPLSAASIAETQMDAVEQTRPPAGHPTGSGPQWRSLGPYTIPNGQTYNPSVRVNVSGRVAAIAVDPAHPAHVLCGAANGGVWESFNRGASWVPRTDYQATTAIGAIAFTPSNPLIVYCGTGEGNWWSWLGVGILRSNDGGTTWSTLCTAPFVGQGFYDLRVDPANANHLIAATTNGLYVSTDGGVTWTLRRAGRAWSVSFGSGEILASVNTGVVRSTNGGTTWSAVTLPGSPGAF